MSKEHFPMVFAANLSSVKVKLKLLEDGKALYETILGPFGVFPLASIKASRSSILVSRRMSETEDVPWKDPSGVPYNIHLEEGKIYCLLVDAFQHASLSVLAQSYNTDPQVSILNATNKPLAQVQIAPDFNKNVKIYVQALPPNQPTEFFSLKPKNVAFFWQTQEQLANSEYSFLKDQGHPLIKSLEKERFYFFLTSGVTSSEVTHGHVWDITPQE